MCEACMNYGDGMQWHFNVANYARRVYKVRKETAEGTGAETNPAGGFPLAADILELIEAQDRGDLETYDSLVKEHEERSQREMLGQVVSLDEVLRAVDLWYPIARMTCMCRRLTQGLSNEDNFTCIGMGPGMYKWERWPELYRGGVEFLHPDDARDLLIKMNQSGYAQIIFSMGTPYIAGFCNCQYPECIPIRQRLDYGIKEFLKGHYVAKIDPNLCIGCGLCTSRCQFKAISFNPSRDVAHIDMSRCFGCGLCASVCEPGAITMMRRESLPALANVW